MESYNYWKNQSKKYFNQIIDVAGYTGTLLATCKELFNQGKIDEAQIYEKIINDLAAMVGVHGYRITV
ncbi:MAG: hypothetical protein PHV30_10675 [Candidatus Margulisbacteria bacterium]|nr:hypothetical protein [Candidatus Margulisiibacteriota bacterium]